MTREEAVEKLEAFAPFVVDDTREAIDMAIEALKQEPMIIRCKECKHRYRYECPMYHVEWFTIDAGDGLRDFDFRGIDETQDDGFCDCGEREEE